MEQDGVVYSPGRMVSTTPVKAPLEPWLYCEFRVLSGNPCTTLAVAYMGGVVAKPKSGIPVCELHLRVATHEVGGAV